ncbi:unnamed protein product, partial [Prorocentrum cordatum]
MELVHRKLQMCEHKHRERAIGATQGDEPLGDAHLDLVAGETRGLAMVSPSLLSEKLKTEAAILRERRKTTEERAEHQASASSKEGKGGQAVPQSLVDKQRPEIAKLTAQIATAGTAGKATSLAARLAASEPPLFPVVAQRDPSPTPLRAASAILESPRLDAVAAPGRGRRRRPVRNASVGSWMLERRAAVNWLRGREGGPDFNSLSLVRVFRTCGAAWPPGSDSVPGYLDEPAKPAAFAVDSVALPLDGVKGNLASAWLVRRLSKAEVITFGEDAACTIAPFCVAKSDGRRRLVIARKVNSCIHDPATVELPTAGVWSGLRTREGDELVVEQVDIEAAFYRTEAPAGLSVIAVLPSVLVSDLAKIDPSSPVEMISGKRTATRLVVLPTGWTLPSAPRSQRVDGAAGAHRHRQRARGGAAAVERELEAGGLRCKGIATTADERAPAGLVFQRATGEARLSSIRPWKMHLALLGLASQKYVPGRAVFQRFGHCKWADFLWGALLSVFSSERRCARKAGVNAWRPRPDVASELRAAGALLGLACLSARRPVDPLGTSAGASTGNGDPEGTLFGGIGVAERPWPTEAARGAARLSALWRYLVAGGAAARDHAFSSQLAAGPGRVNHDQDEGGPEKVITCAGESAPDGLNTDRETQGDFVGLDAHLIFPL